jgi:hypothetical protein
MDSRPAETSTSNTPSPAAAPASPLPAARHCENCGAQLHGEHCYACGQPTKGLVRHFGSILGDFADTVFNVDGRIFRTLGPLLFKPGFLSLEYFAGRRVRYVSPVRLFVFTCLLAFLASRLSVDPVGDDVIRIDDGDQITLTNSNSEDFDNATSVAEVEALRDRLLGELDRTRKENAEIPGLAFGLDRAREAIEQAAEQRIRSLEATDAEVGVTAEGSATIAVGDAAEATPPAADEEPTPRRERPQFNFGDGAWDAQTNPLRFSWLPEVANVRINQWLQRASDNLLLLRDERSHRQRLGDYALDLLPQTLFVMLPLFALMLKLAYVFKRRLYMEHLIVALHSHAFLSLAVLLLALLTLARGALGTGVVHSVLGGLEIALIVWMPLYLLIMQKRVYRQGWIMSVLKYSLLGTAYTILISVGITFTLLISLVAM